MKLSSLLNQKPFSEEDGFFGVAVGSNVSEVLAYAKEERILVLCRW